MHKKTTGKLGEKIAISHLKKEGHSIITPNYFSRYGEIDIISLSPKKQLTFTEVKTRRSLKFGSPEEAITRKKLQKIYKTALHFLSQSKQINFYSWRIDLIAIELDQADCLLSLNHYKNLSYG